MTCSILQLSQSLATPAIATLAAVIAFGQWRIARNKLKLDLFEKRTAVYNAARSALTFVARKGSLTYDERVKYIAGIQPAKWLFNESVWSYLNDTLHDHMIQLVISQDMLREDPEPQDKAAHTKMQHESLKFLGNQLKKLDELMIPFLHLKH